MLCVCECRKFARLFFFFSSSMPQAVNCIHQHSWPGMSLQFQKKRLNNNNNNNSKNHISFSIIVCYCHLPCTLYTYCNHNIVNPMRQNAWSHIRYVEYVLCCSVSVCILNSFIGLLRFSLWCALESMPENLKLYAHRFQLFNIPDWSMLAVYTATPSNINIFRFECSPFESIAMLYIIICWNPE